MFETFPRTTEYRHLQFYLELLSRFPKQLFSFILYIFGKLCIGKPFYFSKLVGIRLNLRLLVKTDFLYLCLLAIWLLWFHFYCLKHSALLSVRRLVFFSWFVEVLDMNFKTLSVLHVADNFSHFLFCLFSFLYVFFNELIKLILRNQIHQFYWLVLFVS